PTASCSPASRPGSCRWPSATFSSDTSLDTSPWSSATGKMVRVSRSIPLPRRGGEGQGEGARRGSGGRAGMEENRSPMSEPIVITVPRVEADGAELAGLERDALVLTAEERRWGRRRVTTRAGRELALALPTGSAMAPGDVLHVGPGWYVVIEAAPEPVLAATPRSREGALRLAFEVGNRHF